MVTDDLTQYLDPQNSDRIANLSTADPFAVACFVILALMVPTALILLTVTSRRSAESVWANIENERRYRLLRRSARMSVASTNEARYSQRSTKATVGTPRRVVFAMPPIPESPTKTSDLVSPVDAVPCTTASAGSLASPPTPSSPEVPFPASTTSASLYDRWWRSPEIEMQIEDPEGRRRWSAQVTDALLRQA